MTEAKDIELSYELWEQNIETLRTLRRYSKEDLGIVPNRRRSSVMRYQPCEAGQHTSSVRKN
jgi:hypothetical protein